MTPTAPAYGILQIHVRARDRVPTGDAWWRKLARRDLAHQIVRWAHDAELPMAMVYRSHLGYIDRGPIIDDIVAEVQNPEAIVMVEIAGPEPALRRFVNEHRGALTHAHIHFIPSQHWSVRHAHKVTVHPADKGASRSRSNAPGQDD